MSARRNEDWGEIVALPDAIAVYRRDRDVSELVEAAWRDERPIPPIALAGGDLWRALGGRPDSHRLVPGSEVLRAVVDVGEVVLDGARHAFVAHVVARRSWWFGSVFAVMNSEWLGDWDVAPRAHPGDGRVDVVQADLPVGDRIKAWRRVRTGTHVPHPNVSTRQCRDCELDFGRALRVSVDGEVVGRARRAGIRVEPEALVVHV